jgi:hypothetical protein
MSHTCLQKPEFGEWECKTLIEKRVLHFRITVRKPHGKIPQGNESKFDRKEPILSVF